MVSYKKGVLKHFKIFTGKHPSKSFFLSCNFIKNETLALGYSCEFCKIFKSTYRTLLVALLALYFAITYCWQLSSSKKPLVGEKIIYIFQGFYRFRFPFFIFFFFFFFSFNFFDWQTAVYLVCYAKSMLYSEQLTVLLAWRHLNTMILTNLENLNSISNIFQETHDFLVLAEPVIICIYLRTTDRHFRDQVYVRHPTSKLLKCDLVQTLNIFWNPGFRIFDAWKASLVYTYFGKRPTPSWNFKHFQTP